MEIDMSPTDLIKLLYAFLHQMYPYMICTKKSVNVEHFQLFQYDNLHDDVQCKYVLCNLLFLSLYDVDISCIIHFMLTYMIMADVNCYILFTS